MLVDSGHSQMLFCDKSMATGDFCAISQKGNSSIYCLLKSSLVSLSLQYGLFVAASTVATGIRDDASALLGMLSPPPVATCHRLGAIWFGKTALL